MNIPRIVEVSFLLPGIGIIRETYDMLSVNDRACWSANASTYAQAGVLTVSSVNIPDDRPKRVAAYHRLLRMRGAAGKRLGLVLRTNEPKERQ